MSLPSPAKEPMPPKKEATGVRVVHVDGAVCLGRRTGRGSTKSGQTTHAHSPTLTSVPPNPSINTTNSHTPQPNTTQKQVLPESAPPLLPAATAAGGVVNPNTTPAVTVTPTVLALPESPAVLKQHKQQQEEAAVEEVVSTFVVMICVCAVCLPCRSSSRRTRRRRRRWW